MPNVKDLLEQLKTGAASQKKAAQTQANANGRGSIGDLAAQIQPDAVTEGELFRKLFLLHISKSNRTLTGDPDDRVVLVV